MGVIAKLVSRFTTWPPMAEVFANAKWGAVIWDTEKPTLMRGTPERRLTSYAQSVINRYVALVPPLRVDGGLGPLTEQAVRATQERYGLPITGVIDQATWDLLDWLAFESYWKVTGFNKYTDRAVNDHGMTRVAAFVECYVRANFPERQFPRNWMVDRTQRGSTTTLSEHARGRALDFTKITVAEGTPVAEWLEARASRWNLEQVIYNHRVAEPVGGRSKARTALAWVWRTMKPTSLQHTDHIHVTTNDDAFPAVRR